MKLIAPLPKLWLTAEAEAEAEVLFFRKCKGAIFKLPLSSDLSQPQK